MSRALTLLRALNRAAALLAGGAVLLCAVFILVEIALRRAGHSIGGSDEISGYVMAGITTWGFSYALIERAHVRIDMIRGRLPAPLRSTLDLIAITALAGVAVLVAVRGWPVLGRSIQNASRANTPLETPLWIPQLVWWSGLVWFAAMACLLALIGAGLILRRAFAEADAAIGPPTEAT
ncbi:TRAP transporter small permease subunit [Acuticoccus kandeliae]|uniref:TRAP transporter small permease subunit n=1 Tax=Acuticoccus kandeliae TaxID=2073160 RepID=UPI000D3EDF7E|nr:TRAP transporter small permease [Acuticoccus kandeliae]